jgi:hypothetical protein
MLIYEKCLTEGKDWPEYGALKDAIVYSIDNIAHSYWRSPRLDWDVRKGHFSNLLPPAPIFFLQYEMPKYSFTAEGWQKTEGEQQGFLFMGYPIEMEPYITKDKNIQWLLRWFPYTMLHDDFLRHGNSMTIGLNSQGRTVPLQPDKEMLIDDITGFYASMGKQTLKVYIDVVFATIHPCFLWISDYHERIRQ